MSQPGMKALSLTQPWATLVAIGAKKWETRNWPTRFRGPVAIHASKSYPRDAQQMEMCEHYADALNPRGGAYTYPMLSCGKIIAIANLTDCQPTNRFRTSSDPYEEGAIIIIISAAEYAFGNYDDYRFAFKLECVQRIEPIACKGALGFWTVPEAVANEVRRARVFTLP